MERFMATWVVLGRLVAKDVARFCANAERRPSTQIREPSAYGLGPTSASTASGFLPPSLLPMRRTCPFRVTRSPADDVYEKTEVAGVNPYVARRRRQRASTWHHRRAVVAHGSRVLAYVNRHARALDRCGAKKRIVAAALVFHDHVPIGLHTNAGRQGGDFMGTRPRRKVRIRSCVG
jgi:hypothetical protein